MLGRLNHFQGLVGSGVGELGAVHRVVLHITSVAQLSLVELLLLLLILFMLVKHFFRNFNLQTLYSLYHLVALLRSLTNNLLFLLSLLVRRSLLTHQLLRGSHFVVLAVAVHDVVLVDSASLGAGSIQRINVTNAGV